MERALSCLRGYADRVREAGGDPASGTVCVGTSSSRDARNGGVFFERVQRETGFRFRVLSGDDEAKYTFLGALPPESSAANTAVIDIGGGSTELICRSGEGVEGRSIDVGSVRFTERYLKTDPVTDTEFWACQAAIDQAIQSAVAWRERRSAIQRLVGVAGTATTLAAWHLELPKFDAARIDECVLTRGDVHRMVEELKWRTVEERTRLAGIERGRADVLLAGALILWRTMELFDFGECQVSTRGLRFGILGLQC
jgi:exopolyphosphatase/guanosine-5'-triphosphate,3'-diphosphate pyrophosphatase